MEKENNLPKKQGVAMDSRTRLLRLLTPDPVLVRAAIPVALLNFFVPQFLLLNKKLKVVASEGKVLRCWHPGRIVCEVVGVPTVNGFEGEERSRLTSKP